MVFRLPLLFLAAIRVLDGDKEDEQKICDAGFSPLFVGHFMHFLL